MSLDQNDSKVKRLADWLSRNMRGLVVILLVLAVAYGAYSQLSRPTEVRKKTTQTLQTTSQTTGKTVEKKAVDAQDQSTYKKVDDIKKDYIRNEVADRNTKTITSKTVTRWDPITNTPIETCVETSTTEDVLNTVTGVADHSTAATALTTTAQTAVNTQTTTQTDTDTKVVKTDTKTAEEVTKTGSGNSPIGVVLTDSARIGVTYDVIKYGKLSLAGLVEVDPKEKRVSGIGAGINTDVAKGSRYFAGVYGKYDIETKSAGVTSAIGMRF